MYKCLMICTVSCSSSLQVCNDTQEALQLWCIPRKHTDNMWWIVAMTTSFSGEISLLRVSAGFEHSWSNLHVSYIYLLNSYHMVYIYIIPELLLKRTKDFCTLNSRSGERRSCMLSLLSRFRIMNPWPGEDTLGERRRHPHFFSHSDKLSTAQPVW